MKKQRTFYIDLVLAAICLLTLITGLIIHAAGHGIVQSNVKIWRVTHIVWGVLFLILPTGHIRAHRGWYKSLPERFRQRPACERWKKPPVNLKTMSPVSSRNGSTNSSSPVPRWAALVRKPLFWTRRVIYGSPSSRPSMTMSMWAHGKRSPMTLQDFAAWMFPSPC